MRALAVHENSVIVIRDGRFAFVGHETDVGDDLRGAIDDDFDANGATAVPGFVDSHTHLPFAGYRETEFNRRLQGETYEQIAASGGGIASSVLATRQASQDQLVENLLARTHTMSRYGTTTAEAKSGYGLDIDAERKQLRAIREANETSSVRLIPTCLAAHDFPPESRGSAAARRAYVSAIIGEILPAVTEEKLAVFCDVFVERGVFTPEEGDAILRAGAALGLIPRMHADELSDTDGASLAASLGCRAGGLEHSSQSSSGHQLLPDVRPLRTRAQTRRRRRDRLPLH